MSKTIEKLKRDVEWHMEAEAVHLGAMLRTADPTHKQRIIKKILEACRNAEEALAD